jgi:MFS family permease
MTVLLAGSALTAGRLIPRLGPRTMIAAGCALFAAGLILTSLTLSTAPADGVLMATLALAGLGIGITVVPVTSSVLDAVPPERSGMAASAANTSREVGALAGVGVLGAIVNAQLRSDLTGRLRHLHIPVNFQSIVLRAVETGGVPAQPSSGGAGGAAGAGNQSLVQQVIHAAYAAFHSGLRDALALSAALVLAAGILAAVTLPSRPPTEADATGQAVTLGPATGGSRARGPLRRRVGRGAPSALHPRRSRAARRGTPPAGVWLTTPPPSSRLR